MRPSATLMLLLATVGLAAAQDLQVFDDEYGVPYQQDLVVEAAGVMSNDVLDGENAGESGATAELVTDVAFGTLALAPDGSFVYAPGPGFDGADSFVYRAVFGAVSAQATVVLTACEGGPDLYTCWNENAFLARAATLGYGQIHEGFEGPEWDIARSPFTAPAVVSQGIRWTSNHTDDPAFNNITTGPGPARTGQYAGFDLEHGYSELDGQVTFCDVDNPPEPCLYHDGWTGEAEPGTGPIHGFGGWITGIIGARIAISLDDGPPVEGGNVGTGAHRFHGVIDTRPAGFSRFSFVELDGKVGQALYIWGDDMIVLTESAASSVAGAARHGLESAGPNPASGATAFRFTLPAAGEVQLEIFDQRGRRLRTLLSGPRAEGAHTASWDGRDASGRPAGAGTYFGRLTVDGDAARARVRKITLTR